MQSMTQTEVPLVIGGVDAHADVHHYAALDSVGMLLGSKAFAASTSGHADALGWLRGFGRLDGIAAESTGSYAAGLVRYLRQHGIEAREVNQPHPHSRQRVGKSDPVDAEMAARLPLAGKATAIPRQTEGIVEAIRTLRVARSSAVKARTIAMIQIRDLIITAPAPLREQLAIRKSPRGKATICARFRLATSELRDPAQAAKFALRALARRIDALDEEITASISSSSRSSRLPRHGRSSSSGSRPGTPARCSPQPARTSAASRAKHRSRGSAAPARSQPHQAKPSGIA